MTHEELFARIKEGQWVDKDEMHLRSNALRAVVELHKPDFMGCCDNNCCGSDACSSCLNEYPCPTIQAIEKELG
jgi:hypothetical protein